MFDRLAATPFRALSHPNYALFFFGQGLSSMGTWMQRMAVAWLVYRLTDSALLLGSLTFVSELPTFLAAPVAGVLADRWDRRKTLLALQACSLVQALLLTVLVFSGRLEIWHLFVLGPLLGLLSGFDIPVRQSLVVHLVADRNDLPNALAMNAILVNVSRLIGPAAAGLLISALGEGPCFLLNTLSYLGILAALWRIKLQPHTPSPIAQKSLWTGLQAGFRYIRTSAVAVTVLFLLALISLLSMARSTLLPIFAAEVFTGGPDTLGFLLAANGLGSLAGAFFLARRRSSASLLPWVFLAAAGVGITLQAFAATHSLQLALPVLFLCGCSTLVLNTSCNTVLQAVVTDEMRGRAMSFFTMAYMGMAPFGSLLAGFSAEHLGAPATVAIAGLLCLAAAILAAAYYYRRATIGRRKP